MVDVSIIIVAWNVRRLLGDCLKSVYEQTKAIDFEVIYVDNASEDGSVEMVKEQYPSVRIVENDVHRVLPEESFAALLSLPGVRIAEVLAGEK